MSTMFVHTMFNNAIFNDICAQHSDVRSTTKNMPGWMVES
jgi:hypothetical protein